MSKILKDVVLLTEAPAVEDLFGGGGHQRTAVELVRTLDLLKARGGAVGLEGGWGSGKSTVLQLAKILLRNRGGISSSEGIFTFDLWKHQGSDIRETFLLSLLDYVQKDFSGLKSYVDDKKQFLSRKVEETEDRVDRTYSIPAMLFLLASPLIPLMLAWSGPSSTSPNSLSSAPKILGANIADVFWGIIILGYALICIRFAKRMLQLGVPSGLRGLLNHIVWSLSHSISAFGKDGENSKQTRYITKLDPVERSFGPILRETIGKLRQQHHTLHIVFDNIDRVDHDKVSIFWSYMRETYASDDNDFEPINNPIVIIPFDKSAINAAQTSHKLSADIVTKTFSRVLRVSAPVLTDWTKFLYICLDRAFDNNIDLNSKYRIGKVLDQIFATSPDKATPRSIISFVNDLASCWSSWGGQISLISIALYLIRKDQLEPSAGLAERIKELDPIAKLVSADADWYRQIAALIFNVDPDHAYQTLLQPEVLEAILAPSGEKIGKLAEAAGFYPVLLRVISTYSSDWAKSEALTFIAAATNVASLNSSATEIRDIWYAFGRSLGELAIESLPDIAKVQDLAEITSHQPALQVSAKAKEVADWATACASVDKSIEQGRTWLLLIDALRAVLAMEERAAFVASLTIVDSPAFVVGMAQGANSTEVKLADLQIDQDSDELTEQFIAHADGLPPDLDATFSNLSQYLTTAQDRQIAQRAIALVERSVAGGTLANGSILRLVAEASSATLDDPLRASLKASVASGVFRGAFKLCAAEPRDQDLSAAFIWAHLTVHKTHEYVASTANHVFKDAAEAQKWHEDTLANLETEGIAKLARLSARAGQIQLWITLAITSQLPNSLPVEVIKAMIDSTHFGALNVWPVLTQYPQLKKLIGLDYAFRMLRHLNAWEKYVREGFQDNTIADLPGETVLDVLLSGSGLSPIIQVEGQRYFEKKDTAEWHAILSGGPELEHFLALYRHASISVPTEPYRGALLKHAKDLLSGSDPSTLAEDWPDVVNAMKSNSRSRFVKDLFGVAVNNKSDQESFDIFLNYYGRYLPYMPVKSAVPKVVDYLIIKLLHSEHEGAQAILEKLADALGSGLEQLLSKAGKKRLGSAISNLPKNPSGKAKKQIVSKIF